MNRREALRSLAGGMAAGALAAAGVAVVVPAAATAEADALQEALFMALVEQADPNERRAIRALMYGMIEKRDTSAEILDAIGEERGASTVATLRRYLAQEAAQ